MPNPYVEPLYEDDSTGLLQVGDDGRAYRQSSEETNEGRASLVGPIKRYGYQGQKGLGGTTVTGDAPEEEPAVSGAPAPHRELTPDELMAWAINQENEVLEATRRLPEAGTAVDPALIRTGYAGNEEGVPEFLKAYMDAQPATDPYAPEKPPSTVDNILTNKYLTEQEKLRYIQYARDHSRSEGTR